MLFLYKIITTAVTTMLTMLKGKRTFHPNFINWSYRKRGKVARSQIKIKLKIKTLMPNQMGPHHAGQEIKPGPSQPPKKSVTIKALMRITLAYSAIKKSANFMLEYSM
jgi:hypothetical protein